LANDIITHDTRYLRPDATSPEKFLRLPKEHIAYARKHNLDINELEALRTFIRRGEPIPDGSELRYFCQYKYAYEECRRMAPTMKIMEWLKGVAISNHYLYKDYLRFCRDLGYDMSDRSVLFPKDIKAAHDREMKRYKINQDKQKDQAIMDRYLKDMMKHGYQSEGLIIRPPVNMQEIIHEGAALHHCVGTYADLVATGKTTILLIRSAEAPEVPFFTAEWKENRLIQCRGNHNCPPTPAVAEFMKAWENRKAKKTADNRVRVMATAAI